MTSQRISIPRTNLYDFAMEVFKLRELQNEFFAKRMAKQDTRLTLAACKKQEKYVDGLINQVKIDKANLEQANLFGGNVHKHFDEKLVGGAEMIKQYGQKVEFEWLNNEGNAWVKTGGIVTAVTIRHAELGRIRSLIISDQQSRIREGVHHG